MHKFTGTVTYNKREGYDSSILRAREPNRVTYKIGIDDCSTGKTLFFNVHNHCLAHELKIGNKVEIEAKVKDEYTSFIRLTYPKIIKNGQEIIS